MNPVAVFLFVALLACSALAQPISGFFGSEFTGGFSSFGDFGSPQFVSSPFFSSSSSSSGSGRSNTGTTVQGPILFPPAPESRDTSGVIVGASGYGFVPPGANSIPHGRGFQSSTQFQSGPSQSFGSFFHL